MVVSYSIHLSHDYQKMMQWCHYHSGTLGVYICYQCLCFDFRV